MSKNILITGANRGLGLGLVIRYLEAGDRVLAACRRPEAAEELLKLKQSYPDRLEFLQLDLGQAGDLQKLASSVANTTIDVLINNAGIFRDNGKAFKDLQPEDLQESFAVNVIAPVQVTQVVLPALKRSSHPVVAMMSSLMGSIGDNGFGGAYSYRSSKAALNMVTKCLSIEYPWLTSVVLHPGWVKTDMGGKEAPLDVLTSTKGLWQVLDGIKKSDNGRFLDYAGKELPW